MLAADTVFQADGVIYTKDTQGTVGAPPPGCLANTPGPMHLCRSAPLPVAAHTPCRERLTAGA